MNTARRAEGRTHPGLITNGALASSHPMPLPPPVGSGLPIPMRERSSTRRILRCFGLMTLLLQTESIFASTPNHPGLSGITEPIEDVLLSTAVAGTIAVVNVKEGAAVKKGSVLLELDKTRETLDVSRRRIARDLLASEVERTRQLFRSSSAVPKEELEKKEADAAAAVVDHEIALEMQRLKLVVSPIDGVVVDLPFTVGEACQALQAVARVVNNARIRFVSHVPSNEAAGISPGQSANLEIMGRDGNAESLTGIVTYISPVVDAASGLLRVTAEFTNPDARVRPGLTGLLKPVYAP